MLSAPKRHRFCFPVSQPIFEFLDHGIPSPYPPHIFNLVNQSSIYKKNLVKYYMVKNYIIIKINNCFNLVIRSSTYLLPDQLTVSQNQTKEKDCNLPNESLYTKLINDGARRIQDTVINDGAR